MADIRPAQSLPITEMRKHGTNVTQDRYKWTALSNTTIGMLMASIDSSIVLISMPAIFRGIQDRKSVV